MIQHYHFLKWDSNFFGIKVYSISENCPNEKLEEVVQKLYFQERADLVYLNRKEKLSEAFKSMFNSVSLVDIKTTYLKEIDPKISFDTKVSKYYQKPIDPKLFELAILAGIYSRFKVDERIPKAKFEELYQLWITNSINKKIAHEVLVYLIEDNIAGMLTLGEKNGRGDIGLIAVDTIHRGKGIAKALMNSAEKWFSDCGYKYMQVVTQKANNPAMQLYMRHGFDRLKSNYVYHLWGN